MCPTLSQTTGANGRYEDQSHSNSCLSFCTPGLKLSIWSSQAYFVIVRQVAATMGEISRPKKSALHGSNLVRTRMIATAGFLTSTLIVLWFWTASKNISNTLRLNGTTACCYIWQSNHRIRALPLVEKLSSKKHKFNWSLTKQIPAVNCATSLYLSVSVKQYLSSSWPLASSIRECYGPTQRSVVDQSGKHHSQPVKRKSSPPCAFSVPMIAEYPPWSSQLLNCCQRETPHGRDQCPQNHYDSSTANGQQQKWRANARAN